VRRAHHFADLQEFGAKNKNAYSQQQRYCHKDGLSSPLWRGLHRTIRNWSRYIMHKQVLPPV
jgi:hypothetical protein